ncbi:uncharacterized protein LOC143298228 [Babylonia areolata]|uniref:uncharacterized protein LOC143298228 n=1 Tax=Babylonia areolata TaxID=304850 RepID=UPI003FD47BBB
MDFSWKQLECTGDKPLPRSSHSVDVINRTVYVIGGEHEPRVPISSAVWSLDMSGRTWEEVTTTGDVPSARNAHASAVVGACIYIFGGRQGIAMGERSLADLYKLDTSTNTWTQVTMTGPVPEARSYHSMAAIGATIYVFGGCTKAGRLNDLHAFDTLTGLWRSLPSSPDIPSRGGAGFTAIGRKLYVLGGFSGKEMGDVHEFDTEASQWRQITATPSLPPRSVFGVASLGRKIVVVGGEVDTSSQGHAGAGQFTDEVYVLDTEDEGRGWRRVAPKGEPVSPRGWFSASAVTEDSLVVFGGNSPDNSRLNDVFLLEQLCE